ncbi:predicted protein [Histoplasma mississippiense (nom. inval.)]|uniref:predicted protein n=1 Tax=Ajellomyces capsulatus (strain NAm1 / WU24) TaxID=2059318 RepID=UPI000157CDCA|nr:predicted protein [Histoplasma mississippiense (nom. inval.)]EDN10408.1 predicted protein [Histoplasma mississippiense (nom. inval.)]
MNRRTRLRHDEDGRQSDSLRLAHSFTTAKHCNPLIGQYPLGSRDRAESLTDSAA